MVAVPGFIPVTIPEDPTVAIERAPEDHVPPTPPVNVVVAPTHMASGFTVGAGPTVITFVATAIQPEL